MAGHSHWSNIKRAKGANDAKRGKIWSKIARKIISAAKSGGGDPFHNLSLRYIIEEAKAVNMPKDTIANAIKKGTGELGAEDYVSVTYEGYAAGGVAIMIEALTNNRSRTAPDLRALFDRHGGNLATTGSVAFQFAKCGIITVRTDAVAEDDLLELALEAGADDVRNHGEVYEVLTPPTSLHKVKDAITEKKIATESADVTYVPSNTVVVDAERGAALLRFIDALEDNDDVQNVSHNAELPADVV